MPRPRRKASRPIDRRISRRRDPEVPEVPVRAKGPDASAGGEATADQPQPDSLDDRIRRMIEAAYT